MKKLRWLLGAIPLIAVIITVIVISRSSKELIQPSEVASAMSAAEGAYFMETVENTSFDANGRVSFILTSPRVDHFPEDNRSQIKTPVLFFYREKGPPWQLRADNGIAKHPSQEMQLHGNVLLTRAPDGQFMPIEMLTNAMLINADTQQASSDDPVQFKSTYGVIQGVGLRADLAREQLRLMSQVEGEYVPDTP